MLKEILNSRKITMHRKENEMGRVCRVRTDIIRTGLHQNTSPDPTGLTGLCSWVRFEKLNSFHQLNFTHFTEYSRCAPFARTFFWVNNF